MNLYDLTDKMLAVSSADYDTSVRLIFACLKLIRFPLPQVALSGIEIARQYWIDGSVPRSAMESARVACWRYLDEQDATWNTEEPEFCAIRAVICVLHPDPPSDDVGDLVEFFNEVLRGALKDLDDDAFFRKVKCIVCEFRDEIE